VVDTAILPPCLLRHRRFTTRAHPHLFEETRGGAGRKTIDLQPCPVAGFFIWYNRRRTLGFGIERGVSYAQLVTDALVMAIWRRGKPDALLHHFDRGSQYTSEQFQRLMANQSVR
jgi:hypothetical protein